MLEQLLQVLSPEQVAEDVFVGHNMYPQTERVYGGQVLAQVLRAGAATVAAERHVHSLHAYFLRMGDPAESIRFEVDRALDAGSLSSRRVVALQQGKPILVSSVSFQRPGKGDDFQQKPPSVPPPHSLPSERERAHAAGNPEQMFEVTAGEELDVRLVQPLDWLNPRPVAPQLEAWMRTTAALPDDPVLHAALIAYMSDILLIDVCLAATGRSYWVDDCRVASLDHALWFHVPARADQWLLHSVVAERVADGRGLARGAFHDEQGTLVASAVQQGLMRLRS